MAVVVAVAVALDVGVAVVVAVAVAVDVVVAVAVAVDVAVAVAVEVLVTVAVGVRLGVAVTVTVGVREGVGVRVGIWLMSTIPPLKLPSTTLSLVLTKKGAGVLGKMTSVNWGVVIGATSKVTASNMPGGSDSSSEMWLSMSTSSRPSPPLISSDDSRR